MKVDYNYRCSAGHAVISRNHDIDEQPCPAHSGGNNCWGTLDGPYIDIMVFLYKLGLNEETKKLGSELEKLLEIDYL